MHEDQGEGDGVDAHQITQGKTPNAASLETYPDRPPDLVPVDITYDTVTEVARQLSWGAGPGGTDSVVLQRWILRFATMSR